VRCGRCGNENDEGNRFCGMCGAALVAKGQAGGQAARAGATGAGRSGAERLPATGSSSAGSSSAGSSSAGSSSAGSTSHDRSDSGPSWPVISGGPSLLGLNLPAPEMGLRRGGGRGDRQAEGGHDALRPSSSVDYLLDDVEEPRRSRGKVILIVAALGLAVGFGYLHWARGGFDWLKAGDKKPTAAATDAGQSGADSGGAATAAGGAAPQGGVAGTSPGASPAESVAPQAASPQTPLQGTPSQGAPGENSAGQNTIAPNTIAPNTAAQNNAAPAVTPQSGEQQSAAPGNAGDSGAAAEAGARGADADSEKESAPAEAPPRAAARKPSAAKAAAAKPVAPKPVDSVTEAERYIYGRGVRQDCDHGLRLLKPAAAQSNVTAMISLGALYQTGTCTPRDLPTAYRWFALALHKEPDNQALQNDLQNLWRKMTPPERQLAIKLSQ
jgi:hypothetical protein